VEFRILGPLEVWLEGEQIPLRGARQRALLAILILHANEIVSSDRLIEDVWGEEPPDSGDVTLRVRISQLRKSLGAAGQAIVTRAPGYMIVVERNQLDLHRFEQLVAEAEKAEPATASTKLRDALALWRGPPLSEFTYEQFAQPGIARLEELRLIALEMRIDADLSLGRHRELVPELESLVAQHPLREGPRRQLMLALYRSGRQGDALELYRRTRQELVGSLGIEPTPALQALEQAILRQDPDLDFEPAPTAQRSILVGPLEPGRFQDLAAIAEALARHPPRELILAQLISSAADLPEASTLAREWRETLQARGVSARSAAFTSQQPGSDLVRIASEHDVDLALVDAPASLLDDDLLRTLLIGAPCDVGVLVGRRSGYEPGPVLVPFAGAEHDWSAIELASWLARSQNVPLRLAGPLEDVRDSSRLLASASLVIQRALGVAAEPLLVPPGVDGLLAAAAESALVVVGLSDRWRRDGLGPVRLALAAEAPPPALIVRRGLRPGGLAPPEGVTRFTWSIAAR
jgi:DNA-binding SARP family transcriptional activator